MNVIHLLEKYFGRDTLAFATVMTHSRLVAEKALSVARGLDGVDLSFVEEAALLHDIGICRVDAPNIGCTGDMPYILHGLAGRDILETEGLPRHALVCERHIGVGLTVEDIAAQELPLPRRDMSPVSIEEKIVCFADLFFSKKPRNLTVEKSVDDVRAALLGFGSHKVAIFDGWLTGAW